MLGVTMGNAQRQTAGSVLLGEMLLDRAGAEDVFEAMEARGMKRAACRAFENGLRAPNDAERAFLETFSEGQVPTAAWDCDARLPLARAASRHLFRVHIRMSLKRARLALDRALAHGFRADCLRAAVRDLSGALAGVYYEDACAVMGREP